MPFFHPSSPSGYCDDEASDFITIEADSYANHFFYNTVAEEFWRAVWGTANYVFQRYDGTTGAYIGNTAEAASYWDEWDILFVESTGRIYSSIGANDSLIILDASDGSLIAEVDSDVYILSLDPYTNTIWCGDWGEFSNLVKLNVDGTRAATYPLDGAGISDLGGIAFSEDYVWVTDYNDPKMYRVLKSDGSVTEYDTSSVLGAGQEVDHIAYDESRDCIWAFDATSTLRKFDIATNAFVDSWTYPNNFVRNPTSASQYNEHVGLYNKNLDKIILSSKDSDIIILIDPDDPDSYVSLPAVLGSSYLSYYEQDGCLYFWAGDDIKKYCCYG